MVKVRRGEANVGLPTLTTILARGACPLGSFGLVPGGITTHYHPAHARHMGHLVWWGPPLPFSTMALIWFESWSRVPLPPVVSGTRTQHTVDETMCYVGLL